MPKNRYKASELAEMLGISSDTVRYYTNNGIIPTVRGDNDYRYFELPEISDALTVVQLRSAGVPIKHVKAIAQLSDPSSICDRLSETLMQLTEQTAELERQKRELIDLYSRLNRLTISAGRVLLDVPNWSYIMEVNPEEISLKDELHQYKTLSYQSRLPLRILYEIDSELLRSGQLTYRKHYFALVQPDMLTYDGFVPYRPRSNATMLTVTNRSQRPESYSKVLNWVEEHNFIPDGELLEEYIFSNENIYISRLWLPIK